MATSRLAFVAPAGLAAPTWRNVPRRVPPTTPGQGAREHMVRGSASMAASTDGVSDTVALALGTATAVPGLQAVRPRGRSMADAFVTERDVVLVQSTDEVHDGELVALRRGSGSPIQLRRIAFEGDHVVLTAEDRRVHPSILPLSQLRLCGRVVAIVRSGPATEPLAGPLRGG